MDIGRHPGNEWGDAIEAWSCLGVTLVAESNGFREFLRTSGGTSAAMALCVVVVVFGLYQLKSFFSVDPAIAEINAPLFIDSETGKTFHMTLSDGMSIPVKSPSTGKMTGYKAEFCFWTKDGHVKTEPTPVLMNDDVGKPGPTFCSECGRLVVHHNPAATPGRTPPPTQAEYSARN